MKTKIDFRAVRFFSFSFSKNSKSITLIELLISMMIIGVMIVGFYIFEIYSNTQVLDSERRARVQNSLTNCLDHMSKYVQQADGSLSSPAIVVTATGFQVRVDFNNPQTPSVFTDDALVSYSLSGNDLSVTCSGSNCPSFDPTPLSEQIISFTVDVQNNLVEIGLVGRFDPTLPVSGTNGFVNPQVEMRTRLICNSSSSG